MVKKTINKEYRVITFPFIFSGTGAYHVFRYLLKEDELDTLEHSINSNKVINNISEAISFFANTFGYTLISGNYFNNYYIGTFIKD